MKSNDPVRLQFYRSFRTQPAMYNFALPPALWLAFVGFTTAALGQNVSFNRDVRPILAGHCFKCHGPDRAKLEGGLSLESRTSATAELESGSVAVVPERPDLSELMSRVSDPDEESRMPPAGHSARLSPAQIETLRAWILQGAQYTEHWSYVAPSRPPLPAMPTEWSDWPQNPIDQFALAKMVEHGLQPSPQADRETLARRVFLDLTGLPPQAEDVDAFLNDTRPDAYEQLVDRLLSRPAFGEHWARPWLDLARYADSAGYADDPPRTIWAYRDWVIRALNDNMPFDQFTIEQLAGDLLPHPTDDQLTATAFHRNTQTNNEGGTTDEEYRNVAVVDRVNTTFAVWMGTTMACAQCHHHKYDPISQEDYFRVFAILNNTQDADLPDDSPRLPLFSSDQRQTRGELERQIAALETTINTPTEALVLSQRRWEERMRHAPEWRAVAPSAVARTSGGISVIQGDQTVLIPTAADSDVYSVDIPITSNASRSDFQPIPGFRIESVPDDSLPQSGSGHGEGNFVVTQVKAQWVPRDSTPRPARYVRISIAGATNILSLAEVQVFAQGKNIALSGSATQSSMDFGGTADRAIDGNTDGNFDNHSVTHTAQSADPWWELDLQSEYVVERIAVWNRTDAEVGQRLKDFQVSLLDQNRELVWRQEVRQAPNPSLEFTPSSIREIELVSAVSDFEQDKFPANSVIDRRDDRSTGWSIGGATQRPHTLTLKFGRWAPVEGPGSLRVIIEQNSILPKLLLGRFRISFPADETSFQKGLLPPAIATMIDREPEQRAAAEQESLAKYFRELIADELSDTRRQLADARRQLAAIQPTTTVLVIRELTENGRTTHIEYRGNYLDKGPEVVPGVPERFPALPAGSPIDRLALARWMVSDTNPLTARVLVNRIWESFFGLGLVATSEEFGTQGEPPTHPELLDWLAVEMIATHWNVKAMVKLIVTSAVYQQASKVTRDQMAGDPDNRWLARGPRVRLSAEAIRDQALAVSGLLSSKMYGPPVNPPQPNFGLTAAFGGSTDWTTSEGEDRYRRAIYTTWRRSNPYPSMTTFDAPNREVCTVRRSQTNTPLQSLVTLNDAVYIEAAQALARWSLANGDAPRAKIAAAFRRCLLRPPSAAELDTLLGLYDESVARFAAHPDQAMRMATEPLGNLPADVDPVDAAAMTVVGNVLLNLDEMFLKR